MRTPQGGSGKVLLEKETLWFLLLRPLTGPLTPSSLSTRFHVVPGVDHLAAMFKGAYSRCADLEEKCRVGRPAQGTGHETRRLLQTTTIKRAPRFDRTRKYDTFVTKR